jgi:hypothetical protein
MQLSNQRCRRKGSAIVELRYNGWAAPSRSPARAKQENHSPGCRAFDRWFDCAGEIPAIGAETRMISINNGSLDLVNLDLEIAVQEEINTDRWAFLSLSGAGRVRMEGVHVTVPNPGDRPAAVVETASGANRGLDKMKMGKKGAAGAQPLFEIRVVESLIAGGADLVVSRDTSPCSIDVQRSALALRGSLLAELGSEDAPAEDAELVLNLEHATCLLGAGLIRMDSGVQPRYLLPVNVVARNNIFAAASPLPFVAMTGNTSPEDFRRLLRWEGAQNFYDRYETYWSIASRKVIGTESAFQFDDWKRAIRGTDSGANNAGIVWRRSWPETFRRNSAEVVADDLSLARGSLAVSGATDGGDVGADLSRLPRGNGLSDERTEQ